MPSAIALAAVPPNLESAAGELDGEILSVERRRAALARSFELPSGREKPNRFWKIDLDALDYGTLVVTRAAAPKICAPKASGLIVCDLATAAREHAGIFGRTFGTALDCAGLKFASLAVALCNTGAFVYVPADLAPSDPIEISYEAPETLFPYTLVVLEHGANCTIIERLRGEPGAFVAGITEIVAAENAFVTYASVQELPLDARALLTRVARPARNANVAWAVAELGAGLSVSSIDVIVDHPGVEAQIDALFFPRGDQHVDVISSVEHNAGDSRSQTHIKSAATGRGQARYLGNIRIAPHAQATESSLRDDALLLSKWSHIDSVPALEIAANDVKAFHGATVGALDEEQIFYMTSRGIARQDAEKMIALGFFEPVLERFPTQALREELRAALRAKVSA